MSHQTLHGTKATKCKCLTLLCCCGKYLNVINRHEKKMMHVENTLWLGAIKLKCVIISSALICSLYERVVEWTVKSINNRMIRFLEYLISTWLVMRRSLFLHNMWAQSWKILHSFKSNLTIVFTIEGCVLLIIPIHIFRTKINI